MLFKKYTQKNCGFTLLELLVSIIVSVIAIAAITGTFSETAKLSKNIDNQQNAKFSIHTVLAKLGKDFSYIGSGLPLDQVDFAVDTGTQTDRTLAEAIVLASSDDDEITYRINLNNQVFRLTAAFDPSAVSTIALNDTTGISADDIVYVSNYIVGSNDGFYGEVDSIGVGSINIKPLSKDYSAGSTFAAGSTLEVVTTVTVEVDPAGPDGAGIYRNEGFGQVLVVPNATFTLTYYDETGATLTPPITTAQLRNNLSSVSVALNIDGGLQYQDTGAPTTYVARATRRFALRNLTYSRR